jgi:acetyl-CoA acetyltransferase
MPAYIPYGVYWTTPFAKWQGALAHLHSLKFAAQVANDALNDLGIAPTTFDMGVLGTTIPQKDSFYGAPWLGGLIGGHSLTGPTINQACATGARSLQVATSAVVLDGASAVLVVCADRTSNGPHIYYPAPTGTGGTGDSENWVLDSFGRDPNTGQSMLDTAENVAMRYQVTTEEQHDVVLMRTEQYQAALADDRAFQRSYMRRVAIPDAQFRKNIGHLDQDEGVFPSTASALAKLKPVKPGGTVTFGGQTHPADGNAGMVVTHRDMARELSRKPDIEVEIISFGQSRVEKAHMPMAPAPAAQAALDRAKLSMQAIDAVTTHNPFAVNDIVFSRLTGFPLEKMNAYGSSLVWGHPQGPTGLRAIIELIETLVLRGGGRGLFTGCAAGDSAMAAVIEVRSASAR